MPIAIDIMCTNIFLKEWVLIVITISNHYSEYMHTRCSVCLMDWLLRQWEDACCWFCIYINENGSSSVAHVFVTCPLCIFPLHFTLYFSLFPSLPLFLSTGSEPVTTQFLEPIIHLLLSPDLSIQKASSLAISNLALKGPGRSFYYCIIVPLM